MVLLYLGISVAILPRDMLGNKERDRRWAVTVGSLKKDSPPP